MSIAIDDIFLESSAKESVSGGMEMEMEIEMGIEMESITFR